MIIGFVESPTSKEFYLPPFSGGFLWRYLLKEVFNASND
jgi:hypothetical protein